MEEPDYEAHFKRYADAYERSLGPSVATETLRSFFAEGFVAAGTGRGVRAGANDETFTRMLEQGYSFYRSIGTKSMAVERVEVEPLYEGHDKVRVFYRAGYERKDGTELTIPFDLVYLLQRRPEGPKIFGFIAGDEMALYKQHGLVGDDGSAPS